MQNVKQRERQNNRWTECYRIYAAFAPADMTDIIQSS